MPKVDHLPRGVLSEAPACKLMAAPNPWTSLGLRDLPNIGKLAGFETTFPINRRDFSVLGNRWGAIPGVLSDDVNIHIIIGAIRPYR